MKRLIWVAITAYALYACSEHSGYIITGEIDNADGQKIVLKKVMPDVMPVGLDSAIIKNGKFEVKGIVAHPEYCVLYIGDNGPLQFFIENSPIHISVNLDTIQNSTITGSTENNLFGLFQNGMEQMEKQVGKLNDDYMAFKLSGEEDAGREKGYLEQMDRLRLERADFTVNFVKEHPNSILSAVIIAGNLSYDATTEQLESYIDGFDTINRQSPWVQSIEEQVRTAKRLQEGQMFSDISLPSPDGQMVSLSDYAGKGKYVMIDFWASWCRPCRMANPHVVKLYSQYKDKGFEIVGISLDKDKKEWTDAIEADGLTWPHMSDLKFWQSEAAKLYAVHAIPNTILLDKDGKILAKNLQPDELEKKLAELLE
jgi:peroxiredoxin